MQNEAVTKELIAALETSESVLQVIKTILNNIPLKRRLMQFLAGCNRARKDCIKKRFFNIWDTAVWFQNTP